MTGNLAASCCVTLVLLSGCATGYHDAKGLLGYTGGYYDAKGPGELFKVGFSGNGFIRPDKVGDYLTYHCAEVARREGHAWFAMYRGLPDAIQDYRAGWNGVGSIGRKPLGEVYILLFDRSGTGLLNAEDVLAKLKPVVEQDRAAP